MTHQPHYHLPPQPKTKMKKPIWQRWWFLALAAVVILAGIGRALGGENDSEGASPAPKKTASVSAAAPTEASKTPSATSSCVAVSDLVANNLAESIDDSATATASAAVKTGDSWLVALRLKGPESINDATAVFEVLDLEKPGQTRAVDGMAHQFTGFPESAFSVADDQVKAALTCLA